MMSSANIATDRGSVFASSFWANVILPFSSSVFVKLSFGMLLPAASTVIELQVETRMKPFAQDVHIRVEGTSREVQRV